MRAFSIRLVPFLCAALVASLSSIGSAYGRDLTTPSLLVAVQGLLDPSFRRSVILMIPSIEPPLLAGVIINNPGKRQVREVFPQARQLKGPAEMVYDGGPVEPDEALVIFRAPSPIGAAARVFGDTYVAVAGQDIAAVMKDPRVTDLRVIAGRAQWSRDQLAGEVMEGSWHIVPPEADLVFGEPRDLWSTLVKGGDLDEAGSGQGEGPIVASADERINLLWPLLRELK